MNKRIILAAIVLLFLCSVSATENMQPVIKIDFTEQINTETLSVSLTDLSDNNFALELQASYNDVVFYYVPKEPLPEGNYILRAQAEDVAGNIGDLFEYEFTIMIKPLIITLVNPRFEYSADKSTDVKVNTTRDAECRYFDAESVEDGFFDQMYRFNSTGAVMHTANNLTIAKSPQLFYVKCFDATRGKYESKLFRLWHDTKKPAITNAELHPNEIFESGEHFTLYVTADENVICKYSLNETNFSLMEYKFSGFDDFDFHKTHIQQLTIPSLKDGVYHYYVGCADKAGLISWYRYADLTVDLHRPFEIIEITAPSYTNETSVKITVKTNYDALCSISNGFDYDMDTDLKTYSRIISDIKRGTSVYNVTCIRETTQEERIKTFSITYDDTPPKMVYVREVGLEDEPEKTHYTNKLQGQWKAEDNETDIVLYNVSIYLDNRYSADELIYQGTTTEEEEWITDIELNDSNEYYFEVLAMNKAGLWSTSEKGDGITVEADLTPDTCNNGKKDSGETGIDCGGVCPRNCLENGTCSANSDCESNFCYNKKCITSTCNDDLKGPNEADVDCGGNCSKKCDVGEGCGDDDDCTSGNCDISLGECVEAGKCYNKKLDPGETDVDCGGVCLVKCDNGDRCESDYDCRSGNCLDSRCFEPTCSDGMKNQDEADVDCGGRCSKCEIGEKCMSDSDCASENCKDNICTEATTDKDNDGLLDEWENKYNEGDLDFEIYDTNGNGISDADEDFDSDELKNIIEARYGTDPHKKDTDGDGYSDGEEIDKGTSPVDSDDYPRSGILIYVFLFIAMVILGVGGYFGFKKFKEMRESKIPLIEEKPEIKPTARPITEKKTPKEMPTTKKMIQPEIKERLERAKEEKKKKIGTLFEKFRAEKPVKIEREGVKPKITEEEPSGEGWVELKVPKETGKKEKRQKISPVFEKLPKISGGDVFLALSKMIGSVVKEKTVKEFTDVAKKRKLTKEELITLINKFSKEKKLDEESLHKILASILEEKKTATEGKLKEKLLTIVEKEIKRRRTTKKKE